MGLLSLLFSNPVLFVVLAVLLLYSIIAHEVAHGWVALLFGDDTAKRSGRLTLDPAPHFDPLGALMLFLVGFGWARPVPVDYARLSHSRLGLFCVSLAGCAANILIAMAGIFFLKLENVHSHSLLVTALPILVRINIILGAFNLIPIPPLDGSKILMSFLPKDAQLSFARFEPFGFPLLIVLLFTGLLNPLIAFMQDLIYTLVVLMFSGFK
ncbi:MAG: site-2 protease family protein [Candidatus Omnitrophota bacterium]|jgi:Zn-dependent protease